jgi:hypothetical protein
LVEVLDVMFVFVFLSVTEASGTTAPVASRTVPLTVPVLACGHARGAAASVSRSVQAHIRMSPM